MQTSTTFKVGDHDFTKFSIQITSKSHGTGVRCMLATKMPLLKHPLPWSMPQSFRPSWALYPREQELFSLSLQPPLEIQVLWSSRDVCAYHCTVVFSLLHIHVGRWKWQQQCLFSWDFWNCHFGPKSGHLVIQCTAKEMHGFGVLGQNCNLSCSSLGIAVPEGHQWLTCSLRIPDWNGLGQVSCLTMPSVIYSHIEILEILISLYTLENPQVLSLSLSSSLLIILPLGSIVSISCTRSSTTDSGRLCEAEQSPVR